MYDLQAAVTVILCNVICAIVCMRMIAKKNWSPTAGFMIGLTFGLLGIALVYSLPIIFDLQKSGSVTPRQIKWVNCVYCDTEFDAEHIACPYCDTHLQAAPIPVKDAQFS